MVLAQNNSVVLSDKALADLRKKGIYLLADGRWMAKIPYTDPDTGKTKFFRPKSPSLDVLLKRQAEAQHKKQEGEQIGGREERPMTTSEWAAHYLEHVVRPKATAGSYDSYKSCISRLIDRAPKGVAPIGPIPFKLLTSKKIEEYTAALLAAGVGAPSVNTLISRLRSMYYAAMRRPEMGIKYNRAAIVEKEEEIRKDPWVGDPKETRLLIELAGEDYRASIIQVATDAGLRRSELCGLQWGDIDWDNHSITLRRHVVASGSQRLGERATRIVPGTKESKGQPEGPLFLSDRSMAMLRDTRDRLVFLGRSWTPGVATKAIYVKSPKARTGTPYVIPANPVADDAFVWPGMGSISSQKPGAVRNTSTTRACAARRVNPDGAVYEPTSMGNWFAALVTRAQLPPQNGATKTLHDLRHDCATFLINGLGGKVVPLPLVANIMRHKDSSVTASVYSHLLKSKEQDGRVSFNAIWAATYADEEAAAAV